MKIPKSNKSLIQKLTIKKGFRIMLVNPPEYYKKELVRLPSNVTFANKINHLDLIQVFVTYKIDLVNLFPKLKKGLKKMGALWISWPKRISKIETDLNENVVREIGIENGLVGAKVISVNRIWSAAKFVYRLKDS